MHFPILDFTPWSGGILIAIISIIHVFVAQFAVGGGLFLFLAERKTYALRSLALMDWVEKYARFFLLLTMVFGGLTGVAIWFIVALISPEGTSFLVYRFAYIWGAEWTFFLGEIVALLLYVGSFKYVRSGEMSPKRHLTLAIVYFIFAFLSLVTINGILSFMLTPGEWKTESSMWVGYFNPTFLSSLVFRTILCFLLAGLFGLLTTLRIADAETRHKAAQMCAHWIFFPAIGLFAASFWYSATVPAVVHKSYAFAAHDARFFIRSYIDSLPLLALIGILFFIRLPKRASPALVIIAFLLGLVVTGAFEWVRETARRPWLVYDALYSNGLSKAEGDYLTEHGLLKNSPWLRMSIAGASFKTNGTAAPISHFPEMDMAQLHALATASQDIIGLEQKVATPEGSDVYGRLLYLYQCSTCHGLGKPRLDLLQKVEPMGIDGTTASIVAQGKISPYMPPFFGTRNEVDILAKWLVAQTELQKNTPLAAHAPEKQTKTFPQESIPEFDAHADKYILTAYSRSGMRMIIDAGSFFTLDDPGSEIVAQLILRDESPALSTDNITLRYTFSEEVKGVDEAAFKRTGNFTAFADGSGFFAKDIMVGPYDSGGWLMPYPTAKIEAIDSSGAVVAVTHVVVPVSSEANCKKCHGGEWKEKNGGIGADTAKHILAAHDKRHGTALLKAAQLGSVVHCRSCHDGVKEQLNLSAAIHGFHATMGLRGAAACASCHASGEQGATHFFRDIHSVWGLDCTRCHGTFEDHALSLLRHEENKGKLAATTRAVQIIPHSVDDRQKIHPREPWVNLPDCASCHDFVKKPDPGEASAFNKWTASQEDLFSQRKDDAGALFCASCHGAPHAVYPSTSPIGDDRDNLQPLQYQKLAMPLGAENNCGTCHRETMEISIHHPIIEN